MAKVKTEIEDSEQEAETSQNSAQVKADIKAEAISEPSDFAYEVTYSDTTLENVTYSQVGLINQGSGSALQYRGRGKRGRMHGSRGRGGQRDRGRECLKQMSKTQTIAPKAVNLQMPSTTFHVVSDLYASASKMGRSILPKVTSDNKSQEGSGLKIDSVFYTQARNKKLNVVKVADKSQTNVIFSHDSRAAVCSGAKTTVALPSTFTLNSGTELPSLASQNISTLPFATFILGSNIFQNTQQDPLILRTGSGPLVNPGHSVSTLQTSSLVPGLQTINLSQPITNVHNLENLSIPINQNTALGIQQNIPQVFNAGTQGSTVYTSNTNQAVGSIMASAVSPSQQMSYTVPVHMGNQIVLMDLPVQYMTGVSLANIPTTIGLSTLIQSPNAFSSTVTPATINSTAGAISQSQPCNSISISSIYPQSVLTTAQSTIVTQKSSPQPLTANISGAKERAVSLKSPPLLLVVSSASPLQTQTPSKICLTKLNEAVYSDTVENSTTFELSMVKNEHNLTTGTQTEESSNYPSNVSVNSLHPIGSSQPTSVSGENPKSRVDQKVSETLKVNCVISDSKPVIVKAEIPESVITSSDNQPVMSTGVSSGNLVSAGIPLFNASGMNVQNILPHPTVASMMQPPFLSHFQTNDNIQHGSISVFNNNTVNIGNTSGLFFQNGLNMQRLNFPVQKHSGQNVWIQNITDSQPVDIGCGNNQQQIFLNSPVHEAVVSSQTINPASNTPSNTNKSEVPQKSPLSKNKSPYRRKLLKNNIWSIQMATPDTMKKSLLSSEKKGKNLGTEVHTVDSSEDFASLASVESQREPKTVKEMLQTMVGIKFVTYNTKSSATTSSAHCSTMNQNTQLQRYKKIRPHGGSPEMQPIEILKGSRDKQSSVQLLINQFDTKTGLLKKNQGLSQCDNSFTNASLDDSDVPQSNDNVLCKITEVKSLTPKPVSDLNLFINANELTDGKCSKGTLFVGPLTKEQLDKIIKNPSELEKYVSVPSGHILSTKALVVPAVSNSNIPKASQSKVASRETTAYSTAPSRTCLSKPEPVFIRIYPKTTTPSHSVTTNTSSSTVTSPPQASISTNNATLSNKPNTTVNNLTTTVTSTGETIDSITRKLEKEQSNKLTDEASSSCSWGKRKRKFLSEQRRRELKCIKNEGSPDSNMRKLSFVGDLKLLKDALRRITVPLRRLETDCEPRVVTDRSHKFQIKHIQESLETDLSNSGDHKLKLGKRKLLKHEQQKVAQIRDKETKFDQPVLKQWIPIEVVGDLAIRGRLLEYKMENEKTHGKRRSNRISARPRLDYADLETLPFKDLDAEIWDQDCNFESFSSSQSPQPTASLSPPVLSPAVDHIHKEEVVCHPISLRSSSQSLDVDEETLDAGADDSTVPVLTAQGFNGADCVSPAKDLNDYYYSSESESDMFDPCDQSLSKADKKKMMWKQHNEITIFLVKHAGRFHSDDVKNEHYCNICHKYKTNGIFRLSHHLKKHLHGSLKCSQCTFEACHEENLTEHRKTLHLL